MEVMKKCGSCSRPNAPHRQLKQDGRVKTRGVCRRCEADAQKGREQLDQFADVRLCWRKMRERCLNQRSRGYARYGGRGIRVCERWSSFAAFLEDMGPRPSSEHTLDRIDNDGNYEPNNCRWATRLEQAASRSTTTLLTFNGETRSMSDWSRKLGIPKNTLRDRIARGWSVENALKPYEPL
jgi:hypothetical protein